MTAEEEEQAGEDEDDEEEAPKTKKKGYSLVFDVVRRFAQPLGIHLDDWEGRIIETEKGIVRLLKAEQDRGPDFLRLADALSALYPRGSEEKRLLDAMLLAVPR